MKNTKTVYEIIQNIPAESMVELSFEQLREFETSLKEEVIIHALKNRQKRENIAVLYWP